MAIYNPELFGLSSLHQLRGRVGRGGKPGFCFLLKLSKTNSTQDERLKTFESEHDGFKISEYDLNFRGEGNIFGAQQSGFLLENRLSSYTEDQDIFEKAYKDTAALLKWFGGEVVENHTHKLNNSSWKTVIALKNKKVTAEMTNKIRRSKFSYDFYKHILSETKLVRDAVMDHIMSVTNFNIAYGLNLSQKIEQTAAEVANYNELILLAAFFGYETVYTLNPNATPMKGAFVFILNKENNSVTIDVLPPEDGLFSAPEGKYLGH